MPELPEVHTIVTTLRPRVVGRTIRAVVLNRTDILCPEGVNLPAELIGRTVTTVDRRGKRIVFTLNDGGRFYIHLGMTGQLTFVDQAPAPLAPGPVPPHTHLELDFGGPRLRFRDPRRFGGVWWHGREQDADTGMGPEPLTLRPPQLAQRLARTTRAIKAALLDQSLIAGLGNIYVDESLFLAGIHPLAKANELTVRQVKALNRAIKATLRRAIRHRGSSLRDYVDAEGSAGAFQKLHRVYDREGEPCRKCRGRIERFVLGGRSTHFCPRCQPARVRGSGRKLPR
jgi:formamidopyrimidine-DNA glycosylase